MGIGTRGLIAVLLLAMPIIAHAAPPPAAPANDARLMALFADDAQREAALDPLEKLGRGEAVTPAALSQIYTDALDRKMLASARQSLLQLAQIDRGKLSAERQVSYDAFAYAKHEEADWLAPDSLALTAVRPFNHFSGLHVGFPTLIASGGALPYASVDDYQHTLALYPAFALVLDHAIARFRQGMNSGVMETRLTTINMIAQIDAMLALPPKDFPFYQPVTDFPSHISEAQRTALRTAYAASIQTEITPAYRRLRAFLHDEYLPAARLAPGLSAMKGGTGLYRRLIEAQTTLRLDPDAVHRLGLREVARIQHEMLGVKQELGFAGPLPAFFDHIRKSPRFHPQTKEQFAKGFLSIGNTVNLKIPDYFSRIPKASLNISPYPDYRAQYEAGGSYTQGTPDGSHPGTFFFNTYDLPSRFLTGMTTLYLHEGIPGHHFQISLAQEDQTLPDFQRYGGNNAYVEGWALYAETLGYPMGLYQDPMQHWGNLDDEMLRAMRLVVDTGLHARGWSREQAIAYMLANSGMGKSDATAEVERYIALPAQALSYKIGALTIQRLRDKAKAALGPRFDLRAFHDQVLDSGALPLPVLEAKLDRWIISRGAHQSPPAGS